MIENRKRVPGIIEKASVYHEGDHDFWTCSVQARMSVFHQSFGNLVLRDKEEAEVFASDIMKLFGVHSLAALEGKEFIGLYCLGDHNETMEGMETPDGKRFTITGFRRKHYPKQVTSAFRAKCERLDRDIDSFTRRSEELKEERTSLKSRWTEWETAPATRKK